MTTTPDETRERKEGEREFEVRYSSSRNRSRDDRYDDDDYDRRDRYDEDDDDDYDDGRNTMTTMHRGIARAVSRGLRAYERELSPGNTGRLDTGNGMVEGFLSGVSRFYEELSNTSRDMLDDMRENRRSRRRRSRRDRDRDRDRDDDRQRVDIDYERLAKLVAEELRKSAVTTTITAP